MIYALVMAGGQGTRLKVDCEKPLFKFKNIPLIDYVLNNLHNSSLIDQIVVALSSNTPLTKAHIKDDLNFKEFHIDNSNLFDSFIDTPGNGYIEDLSFLLDIFQKKSKDDILLMINADLPFISSEIIDYILKEYKNFNKPALSVLVPLDIYKEYGINYSYDFNGFVPSGLNILKSENTIQEEEQLIISKVELALNLNSVDDIDLAYKIF